MPAAVLLSYPCVAAPSKNAALSLRMSSGIFLPIALLYDIGLSEGVAGEVFEYLENLVLVDDYSVGLVQHFFHAGVWVGDFFLAVLGFDEPVNVLHWAWSV